MPDASIVKFLNQQYSQAMNAASGQSNPNVMLSNEIAKHIDTIVNYSEQNKGVLTVVMTSVVYKILNPKQDIRLHQSGIPNGYSGRTFDTHYITPFLKANRFPSMAESGWLTRSLEQKLPYDEYYPGAIKPQMLKEAFIKTIYNIETSNDNTCILQYLLQSLIIRRDSHSIPIAKPRNVSIAKICNLLDLHFHFSYHASGASRLPVLAIYAIYQSLLSEGMKRFNGKSLLPLESHTSADTRSGRLGDIDITNEDGSAYEAVEVKFDIPINHNIVEIAKEKIQSSTVDRYYILSTSKINTNDIEQIEQDINQIRNTHGCQLIINGILETLKYYLRLLDNTAKFIENYATLLETDSTIKYEHKQKWNSLVSQI